MCNHIYIYIYVKIIADLGVQNERVRDHEDNQVMRHIYVKIYVTRKV